MLLTMLTSDVFYIELVNPGPLKIIHVIERINNSLNTL